MTFLITYAIIHRHFASSAVLPSKCRCFDIWHLNISNVSLSIFQLTQHYKLLYINFAITFTTTYFGR